MRRLFSVAEEKISSILGYAISLSVATAAVLALIAAASPVAESPPEVAIARIHTVDPQVHAVIALEPTALEQTHTIDPQRKARGLLYGYAILPKNNIEAAGELPTTAGSMVLLDNVTHRDVPLVTRLRAVASSGIKAVFGTETDRFISCPAALRVCAGHLDDDNSVPLRREPKGFQDRDPQRISGSALCPQLGGRVPVNAGNAPACDVALALTESFLLIC